MWFRDEDCNRYFSIIYESFLLFLSFFFFFFFLIIAEAVYSMVRQGLERHWLLVRLLMNAAKVRGE